MSVYDGWSRCPMCDEWYDPNGDRDHEHVLPQSGKLRERWWASGLSWAEFHDIDEEARAWGHREAKS